MNQLSPTKNTPNFRIFSSLLPSTPTPQSANSMWNNQLYTIQCFITARFKRPRAFITSASVGVAPDDGNTASKPGAPFAVRPRLWTMPREWTARHLGNTPLWMPPFLPYRGRLRRRVSRYFVSVIHERFYCILPSHTRTHKIFPPVIHKRLKFSGKL